MRKVSIAAFLVLLLFVSVYGWLRLRDHASYKNAIPPDADLVAKLHVDGVIRKGLWYAITHPSSYFTSKKQTEGYEEKLENGLSMPANIFFYTRGDDPDVLYTVLPVDSKDEAIAFLAQKFPFLEFSLDHDTWSGYSMDKKLRIVVNDDHLVLAYSIEKEVGADGIAMLGSLLKQTADEELVTALINTEGDLVIRYRSLQLIILITGERITIKGQISDTDFDPASLPFIGKFLESNWNHDLELMFRQSDHTQIKLGGSILRTDTITVYEFNDDVEKVEKKEVQTYRFPGIALSVKIDSLFDSERVSGILKKQGLALKSSSDSTLYFANTDSFPEAFSITPYRFRMEADLDSFVPAIDALSDLSFMEKFKSLDFRISKGTDKGYEYESTIILKENVMGILMETQF